MTKYFGIIVAILACVVSNAQANIIVAADDFDGNTAGAALNPSGGVTLTTAADPADPNSGNMVGCVEFDGGNQWQSLASIDYTFPSTVIPGVSTYTFSYDLYIPSGSGATFDAAGSNGAAGDWVSSLIKVNSDGGDTYPGSVQHRFVADADYPTTNNIGTADTDQWITITDTFTVPAVDNDPAGAAVTGMRFTISLRDQGNTGASGPGWGYFDNVSISVVPEPGSLGLIGIAFAALSALRRRVN